MPIDIFVHVAHTMISTLPQASWIALLSTAHRYVTVAVETSGGGAEEFLLRPQRTLRRSPSMSSPFAHASAARSAEVRSLKLTNAHLKHKENFHKLRTHDAQGVNYLDFATWTTERKEVGSTPGNDLMTRVRMVCSVADAGKEERNRDI